MQSKEVYRLPDDPIELERLMNVMSRQHQAFYLAFGALYWPAESIEPKLASSEGTTIRILDVGSGSGIWAAEMAQKYPHAEVIGFDVKPQTPSNAPSNCRIIYLDVVADPLEELGAFDFVHVRMIAPSIPDYEVLLQKLTSILKPGGIITCGEMERATYDENRNLLPAANESHEGSWFTRLWLARYPTSATDYPIGPQPKISEWMNKDGRLTNVRTLKQFLPLGWAGSDRDVDLKNGGEVGKLHGIGAVEVAQSWRSALVSYGVKEDEFDHWLQEMKMDILDSRLKSYTAVQYFSAVAK